MGKSREKNRLNVYEQIGGINMKKKFENVYQFRIDLNDIRPPIWRRIHVPETYTFFGLHIAIQNAMLWSGGHLHKFYVADPSAGKKSG